MEVEVAFGAHGVFSLPMGIESNEVRRSMHTMSIHESSPTTLINGNWLRCLRLLASTSTLWGLSSTLADQGSA